MPRLRDPLLAVLFLTSTAVFCNTSKAQVACGLDARNRTNTPLPVIGSEDMSPTLAEKLRHTYALQGEFRQAESLVLLKQVQTEAASKPCAQALAEFGLGQATASQDSKIALGHFQQAQRAFEQVGTPLALAIVHDRIALMQHLSGENERFMAAALGIATELANAGDPANAIRVRVLLLTYAGNGQKPEEIAALRHELDSVTTDNVPAVRGYIEWAWGSALRRSGRYAEIAGHFQNALKDFSECGCDQQTKAALLLTMAAAADSSGSAATVLQYANQADEIYRKTHADSLRPQSMRLIAAAYARQHDWPRSITEYEDALRLANEHHSAYAIPDLRIELADAYGEAGQALKGLTTLAELETTKLTPLQHCNVTSQRAVLEHQAKHLTDAEKDGADALSACKTLMQPADYARLDMHMADVDLLTGRTEDAVKLARESVAITDTQRPRVRTSDAALVQYNENQNQIYTVLIRALLQAGKPEEALLASEQDRARAFYDLASTEGRGQATPDVALRRGVPPAADLRNESHPFALTMDDIHKIVDGQHSTLISYWVADDRAYVWVMMPGKPVIEKDIPLSRTQLASLVRATLPGESPILSRGAHALPQVQTRGGESQAVTRPSRKPWQDLYQALIAPMSAELPTTDGALLTIIPQGPLFQLSFPALLDTRNHYLLERYAIHVAPSIGTLQITSKNSIAADTQPTKYLVLANPERMPSVNGAALPALPGTDAEARGIQGKLQAQQVTLLEGKQAGIDTLMSSVPGSTVLHFATHAIVSDDTPATSFLALDSRQKDGKLTASSVYGMHLKTKLVVLSACRTGRGKISGDGVAGLSRAFFIAGAASLVTTLWDVVDEPTAELMPLFYEQLAGGKSGSASLRTAQLELIHRLRNHQVRVPTLSGGTVSLPETPAYWAAFTLSGQP